MFFDFSDCYINKQTVRIFFARLYFGQTLVATINHEDLKYDYNGSIKFGFWKNVSEYPGDRVKFSMILYVVSASKIDDIEIKIKRRKRQNNNIFSFNDANGTKMNLTNY